VADGLDEPQEIEEAIDIEIPGGEVVVSGKRDRNVQRATTQVISVLSAEDIARTGEGDIAGALGASPASAWSAAASSTCAASATAIRRRC
jgi:hypothetical protein